MTSPRIFPGRLNSPMGALRLGQGDAICVIDNGATGTVGGYAPSGKLMVVFENLPGVIVEVPAHWMENA